MKISKIKIAKEFFMKVFQAYYKNPMMIAFYLFFYFALNIISLIKFPNSYSPFTDYFYLIADQSAFVLAYSFFFSIFIGSAYLSLKNRFSLIGSFKYARSTPKNFLFLAGALAVYSLILFLMANYMKGFFAFSYGYLLAALLIELIFILISSLALCFVIKNTIKLGFGYKKYLEVVLLSILYYFATLIMGRLVSLAPASLSQILYLAVYFLIIYPFVSLILVLLFTKNKSK
jgi:hypothetical protein